MDSNPTAAIAHEIPHFFRVYKDGRVERFRNHDFAPASDNPQTGARSKDVVIVPENNVSVRFYLPKITQDDQKFPLIVYFHGGGFTIESAFSTYYDSYLHSVAAETNVLAISVEYRLAPEHKIPACYDDAWAVMKWVAQGTDPWLKTHADFSRVFLAGDSAGANIAHNMMMRSSVDEDKHTIGLRLVGMALIHPFFGNDEPDKIWTYICPENPRSDDPRFNPAVHPSLLSRLVCPKVLICTAGSDFYKDRGWTYYEALKGSGWGGEVEIKETEGEDHVFHLVDTNCENARCLMKWLADFFHQTG
ncbi:PREDICTED: 2-hydroxyisoflavanone dehydratase-like [Nicotiana attenuata]|uniref:Carboxylesterase 12 n=1 Tax=Nicotiana attenuata TaxID=49451 RepID=A0A314L3R6_NICAT|nr:PREDICTED: 2-hydroxyisoflavanone dehydratase-like [Nicotiana attenuata]OIT35594.1 putative carboxylesterase 12 [Nicotiana attenuata]